MVTPRRAASRGATPALVVGVRAATVTLSVALTGVLALMAFVSVRSRAAS